MSDNGYYVNLAENPARAYITSTPSARFKPCGYIMGFIFRAPVIVNPLPEKLKKHLYVIR